MSSFYEKKLRFYFKNVFDVNHDNYITFKDFDIAVDKYKIANNIPDGDPRITGVIAGFQDLFNLLLKESDYNHDGKISLDEFLKYWKINAARIQNGATFKDLGLKDWMDFAFNCFDVDSDGVVSEKDYMVLIKSISSVTYDEEKTKEAWARLSKVGTIDKSNFDRAWTIYFSSENENEPENYILGPILEI